jgi:hypothetical protein
MKAKLIKTDVNYLLEDNKGVVIGSTSTKEINKLSKQNCDEIFWGLYDTEIEVEIEMKRIVDETKVIGVVKGVKGSGDKITTYKSIPKLDSNGCLILKRAK